MANLTVSEYNYGDNSLTALNYTWEASNATVKVDPLLSPNEWYFQTNELTPLKERKLDMDTKILYNVYVVTKDEELILTTTVIGADEDDAKFLANVDTILRSRKLKPCDVTIICDHISEVKINEKVKKVQLVEKEEK